MHTIRLISLISLMEGFGQALKYPYLDYTKDATVNPLQRRDNQYYWSFEFYNGGCGSGDPAYGGYSYDNGTGMTCVNLVQEKPWDSIVTNIGPGYDVYFFAGQDCCTSGVSTPCSIYSGYHNNTCVTSAGPKSHTGVGFAKSLLIDPHAYQGPDGAASAQDCARPGGGIACPDCPSKRSMPSHTPSQNPNPSHADCEDAPNCELWLNPETNRIDIRFKEGMGPNSDWYHQNVRLRDPWHSTLKTNHLYQRNAGCNRPDQDLHYNAHRSNSTINFGNKNPADIVGQLSKHCQNTDCNNVQWTVYPVTYDTDGASDTKSNDGNYHGGTYDVGGKLTMSARGEYDMGDLAYYVKAMKLHGRNSTGTVKTLRKKNYPPYGPGNPPVGDELTDTFYSGMDSLDINRFVPTNTGPPALQGYMSLVISFKEDKGDLCSFATDIIQGAIGEVSAIGAGFFGFLGGAFCDAVD